MPARFHRGSASLRPLRVGLGFGAGFCPLSAPASAGGPTVAAGDAGWRTGAGLLLVGLGVACGLGAAWWWERRRRIRIEAALRSVNDRFRALFDESPLSICVFDPHDRETPFRIVECNQYACDLHGWTRDELIGSSMTVLTPLKLTYEHAQQFLAELRAGPCRGENPHRRKDGSVFHIEYVARLVVIDGHEYMIGVDRDLSEERARRASEERLRRTAELNQLALRASNDGIWDWAIAENRIAFSDRCREMLGYTVDELPDDPARWQSLLAPEDAAAEEALRRRHWTEDAPYVIQFRARHKDGTWRWIMSRGITLFDAERRPIRMVGSRTDITESKRTDAELLQSRKLRAVGEMVGGIAHEFNNLLTPMLLHAEMLAYEHPRDPALASHIGPIRGGIDRARELTRRILTFGRRQAESRELLDVEEVVRDNMEFLAQTIDRRIHVFISPAEEPALVWANRSDLNQLVVNLALNARDTLVEKADSRPPDGWTPRIEITLESLTRASGARDEADRHTQKRWRRLTVRDTGLGISDEVRERVFEPFFTTKQVGQGTGLGLATAWHVSTSAGGWIEVESRQGEGTAFHVFLPAASDERQAPERMTAQTGEPGPPAPPASSPGTTKRLRVLLVEDHELVADATLQILGSWGYEVDLVRDGLAAWERLVRQPRHYDMVFTDLNLPKMSGMELVRRLREGGYAGRVTVYSGHFSKAHETELAKLQVQHRLPKPFTRAQLASVLGVELADGG